MPTTWLRFTLNGLDGYQPIVDQNGDSQLITIPEGRSGDYVLTAKAISDQIGSYSFAMRETTVTDLPLSAPQMGTLPGSGAALLYRIQSAGGQPLLISLDHSRNTDRVELYLKRGSAPTRSEYQYRFEAPGADHKLLVPNASAGDWYLLIGLACIKTREQI